MQRRLVSWILVVATAAVLHGGAAAGGLQYVPGDAGVWPANLVAEVQRRLGQRGFDPGGVDGEMGPATMSAIADFQASEGIEVDGRISDTLLELLDMQAP